ncbi:MAG: hypothetical protein NTW45_10410 [Rhodocyclales bacterium]|nr:hypothetical protein [Rhodocyclales bacterium]
MKFLLYLSPTERQLWGRDGQGWQRVSGEPIGHVWVVTDLVGESFAEIKTPRLFGRDRGSYIARQLATRYPDTPYRTFLTPSQEDDLIGRILPTRHILLGIDAAERLDAELDATPNPVPGVWPVSMLLGLLGQDRDLPADLFVVMPAPGTLRIVFLKNRTPVLTRLTLTPNQPSTQVDEIIRTLRHLENTQVVPRNRQEHPVLLLADPSGFEGPMAAAHLKLVSLHRWETTPPADWHFPLFDLALKSPAGQVAPLARRAEFLAARLSKAALVLAAVILVAGIASAGNNLWSLFGMLNESRQLGASIQQINAQIAEVDLNISKFGVVPDTLRRAVALHDDEIVSVPAIDQHLRLIANVLASDSNLRLKDLQWRLLAPGALPCSVVATPDQAAAGAASPEPGSETRKVELSIELAVPVTYGPRDRAQTLRSISGQLAGIEGLTLWQDAQKDLASGSLRGGSILGTATRLTWCMTLPGIASAAVGPNGGSRP